MTAALGLRPEERHLRLTNFSSPMSAPNPASVMTNPPSPTMTSPTWSAMTLELPDAMLAKGPACTSVAVPSRVCISVGRIESCISTVSAPPKPRSSAVTGSPLVSVATTMAPRRSRMSASDVVIARHAMISDATVMSNPVSRECPFSVAFCPTVIPRRKRSFTSNTRRQVILSSSMFSFANAARSSSVSSDGSVLSIPSFFRRRNIEPAKNWVPSFLVGHRRRKSASADCVFSWNTRVSIAAARRLLAAPMA
mmetsp:Transcript_21328/g.52672  ORF Transcript_21328/g.52672 Transcript_21328/m.52672 type:complete len:252 (-) Transcript_21328:559-1314(-)